MILINDERYSENEWLKIVNKHVKLRTKVRLKKKGIRTVHSYYSTPNSGKEQFIGSPYNIKFEPKDILIIFVPEDTEE